MAARLGAVLFWASILIAGAYVWVAVDGKLEPLWTAIPAAIVVLIGWAFRYILAGKK